MKNMGIESADTFDEWLVQGRLYLEEETWAWDSTNGVLPLTTEVTGKQVSLSLLLHISLLTSAVTSS